MAYCLIPSLAEKFKKALVDGTIDPEKLVEMSSEERRAFFERIIGKENARNVNSLFESKLLLKNQQQGLINWAKTVGGIKPETRRDLISRIERMDQILSPSNEKAFLEDLASKKLGTDVTFEEAQKIMQLSQEVRKARESLDINDKNSRIAYGNKLIEMTDYVNSISPKKAGIVSNVLNIPKTIMSTLDFSAPLRQGWGMMSRGEFYKNLGPMFKAAFNEKAFNDIRADIITRPTYDLMKAGGLRITELGDTLSKREEQFMSSLLDKIPGVKQSERGYISFLNKLRADTFDTLVKQAELNGEYLGKDSPVLKDIARVVNDFTGSGAIGKNDRYANAVPALNATFFSPRKISATINMLNPQRYVDPRISPTARKAALRQLLGSVGMSATLLGLARLAGAEITLDPTSADFGKIKVGDTRYDVTGGNGNYAVLLARLLTNKTTSTTSGITTELGKGYKPTTRLDLLTNFARNKLSPNASFVADWLVGSNAIGDPFDVKEELKQRAMPLIIQDAISLQQDDPTQVIPGVLASMFGIGIQTYSAFRPEDWSQSTTKTLQQFHDKVGDDSFTKANDEFNSTLQEKTAQLIKSSEYKALSSEEKKTKLADLKKEVQDEIFKEYSFKYKRASPS